MDRCAFWPIAAVVFASLMPATGLAQTVIGQAAAVNPQAQAQRPGDTLRTLRFADDIVQLERIRTQSIGGVQLLFVDRTTLTVGPNSDLVVDEYVFNPQAGTATLAGTLARGVMRFVGGAASKEGGAVLRTPSATITVRGGIATVVHRPCVGAPNCGTQVVSGFGAITVTSAGGSVTLHRPGFVVTVSAVGAPPSRPVRIGPRELAALMAQLTSCGRQNGGSPVRPTDQGALAAGLGSGSGLFYPGTFPYQAQNRGQGTAAAPPFGPPVGGLGPPNSGRPLIPDAVQQAGQSPQMPIGNLPPSHYTPPISPPYL